MLSPAMNSRLEGNNASCVLRINNGYSSLLIPGDVEKQAELELVHQPDSVLKSTALIAPHHGSMTSSGPAFVRAVSPEYVIFSSGYLNRFRLPKQDIINRYKKAGAVIINTPDSGAVRIQSGKAGMIVTTERETSTRFWNFSRTREEE